MLAPGFFEHVNRISLLLKQKLAEIKAKREEKAAAATAAAKQNAVQIAS